MITKTRKAPRSAVRSTIKANTSITAGVKNRNMPQKKTNINLTSLTPEQRAFARQIQANISRKATSITAATNTTNIMARPDFLELLPIFVQKLVVLDVFGSVAMRSRQQLIPYFKFIAENTKGETKAGDVLSSAFVNRQGQDPNFTGRVVKNEIVAEGTEITDNVALVYTPILPCSVTIKSTASGVTTVYTDDGNGQIVNAAGTAVGYID